MKSLLGLQAVDRAQRETAEYIQVKAGGKRRGFARPGSLHLGLPVPELHLRFCSRQVENNDRMFFIKPKILFQPAAL